MVAKRSKTTSSNDAKEDARDDDVEPPPLSLMRLRQMRKEIDSIDNELSLLLLRRLELASAIGSIKHKLELPVRDTKREDAVLEKVATQVCDSPLAKNVVGVYLAILDESCQIQSDCKNLD